MDMRQRVLKENVRDMNRDSVNGIPVTFEAAPSCQGVAKVSPQRVVTHNGLAQASVQAANTTGVCRLAIRVDESLKQP
jgi:hypothetical protein